MSRLRDRNSTKNPCKVSQFPKNCETVEAIVVRPEGQVTVSTFSRERPEEPLCFSVRPYDVLIVRRRNGGSEETVVRYYCEARGSNALKLNRLVVDGSRMRSTPSPSSRQLDFIEELLGCSFDSLPGYKKRGTKNYGGGIEVDSMRATYKAFAAS